MDFASLFGVTRSALANYELGRSRPPKEFLEKIKERTGIEVDTGMELADYEEELRALAGDGSKLTEDELAIIRILRVVLPEDARHVINELVQRIEKSEASLQLTDPQTVALDLARLYTIVGGARNFLRGVSGENVVQVARALAGVLKA
jgi:transcriptional regulator with XRE-family HTH domain